MVGRRTVGCCSHIATLIFYLGYARHFEFELSGSKPGSFLNSILVTLGSSSESSDIESKELNTNETHLSVVSPAETISMKNSLSFSTTQSITGRTKKVNQVNSSTVSLCSFRSFCKKLPSWGGKINVNVADFGEDDFEIYQQYQCKTIKNSCSIDYFLFGLWYSKQLTKDTYTFNSKNTILNKLDTIISLIDKNEWDRAKTFWIFKFLQLSPNEISEFSIYGGVYDSFIKHLRTLQCHEFICICDSSIRRKIHDLIFRKIEDQVMFSFHDKFCNRCNNYENSFRKFITTPLWLFIEIENEITIEEVPLILMIGHFEYKYLFSIIHEENLNPNLNHFKAIFKFDESFFLIDDLFSNRYEKKIPLVILSWVIYYLA